MLDLSSRTIGSEGHLPQHMCGLKLLSSQDNSSAAQIGSKMESVFTCKLPALFSPNGKKSLLLSLHSEKKTLSVPGSDRS